MAQDTQPDAPQEVMDLAEIRALSSVMIQRLQFMRQAGVTFGGKRDLYEILGYDKIITVQQYRDRYARGGVAGRIVEALPKAAWRGTFEIVENKDPKRNTPFEKAWWNFADRLKLNAVMQRANILARLSTYSVILIGTAHGAPLDTELPKGNNLDQVLFLSPFTGGGGPGLTRGTQGIVSTTSNDAGSQYVDVTIREFDEDPRSPRFGLPKTYQLKRLDYASPELSKPVHWSRVIHIAEGCLDNEVYGQPALERVWNLLDDLDKVTGGGAEAFWLRANQGLHVDVDKDMQLGRAGATGQADELTRLRDQAEEYQHGLTRILRTRGVKVQSLGSDTANFSGPADAILTQISGSSSMPKRILTGSEMGELASSQDRDNWKDQVNGYQTSFCGPYAVQLLVDRLIAYGYSAKPAEPYEVIWPHIQVQTEQEKADGAKKWADTKNGNRPIFTDDEIRDKWYQMEPLTEEQKEANKPEPPQPIAGAPGAEGEEPKPLFGRAAEAVDEELLRVLEAAIVSNNTAVIDEILGVRHTPEDRKYATTQIELPRELAVEILAFGLLIPQDELAEKGREEDIHVTVKYGLVKDDPALVRERVESFGPVCFTLGKTGFFSAQDYDVLQIPVQSTDLSRLNRAVASAGAVDTQPFYMPHITIAYLKPGMGIKYAGDARFEGAYVDSTTLTFSSSDRSERTEISLA